MMLWIGSSASPQVLKDLLDVDDMPNVDPRLVRPFIKSPRHCQKLIAHCADMPPSFANPLVHAGAKHSRATFRPAWVHPAVRGDATKHGRQRDRVQRHARRGPKQCGYVIP